MDIDEQIKKSFFNCPHLDYDDFSVEGFKNKDYSGMWCTHKSVYVYAECNPKKAARCRLRVNCKKRSTELRNDS